MKIYKPYEDEILIKNFWNKIAKGEDCWLWEGNTELSRGGFVYGRIFRRRPGHSFQGFFAHRLAWQIHHKSEIPPKMCVCHNCDTPLCVNPDHLFLGTHKDNMQDAKKKGRLVTGNRHHNCKLSEEDVKRIRKEYSGNYSALAQEYNVCYSTISRIVRGVTRQCVRA